MGKFQTFSLKLILLTKHTLSARESIPTGIALDKCRVLFSIHAFLSRKIKGMIPYRYTVYSSCQREAHSLWRTTRSHETVFCGFILYGKRTTHLTKRTVDESGAESMEELHFFYEEQSVPTFVECNGVKYHYIHNSRGDIVAYNFVLTSCCKYRLFCVRLFMAIDSFRWIGCGDFILTSSIAFFYLFLVSLLL